MIKVPMSRDAKCGWGCTTQRWREASSGAWGGVISLLPVELMSQVATHKGNSRGAGAGDQLIEFLASMHEPLPAQTGHQEAGRSDVRSHP